jgi:hypothetical protein
MAPRSRYFRVEKDGRVIPVDPSASARRTARRTARRAAAASARISPSRAKSRSKVQAKPQGFTAKAATPQQKEAWVYEVFQNISDEYDLMNDLESFRLHRGWKNTLEIGRAHV